MVGRWGIDTVGKEGGCVWGGGGVCGRLGHDEFMFQVAKQNGYFDDNRTEGA